MKMKNNKAISNEEFYPMLSSFSFQITIPSKLKSNIKVKIFSINHNFHVYLKNINLKNEITTRKAILGNFQNIFSWITWLQCKSNRALRHIFKEK